MANNTQEFKTIVSLNAKQAQDELQKLKKHVEDLKKKKDDALKNNGSWSKQDAKDLKLKRSSCWPGGTEGQYEDRVVRQEDISMGINPALDYLSMPSSVEIKAGAATEN